MPGLFLAMLRFLQLLMNSQEGIAIENAALRIDSRLSAQTYATRVDSRRSTSSGVCLSHLWRRETWPCVLGVENARWVVAPRFPIAGEESFSIYKRVRYANCKDAPGEIRSEHPA